MSIRNQLKNTPHGHVRHYGHTSDGHTLIELVVVVLISSVIFLAVASLLKFVFGIGGTLGAVDDDIYSLSILKTRLESISVGGDLIVTDFDSDENGWTLYGNDINENELVLISYSAAEGTITFEDYTIIENIIDSYAEYDEETRLLTITVYLGDIEYKRTILCRVDEVFA